MYSVKEHDSSIHLYNILINGEAEICINLLLVNFLLLEAAAFIYFQYISNDKLNLEYYTNKRIATDQYKYFDSVSGCKPNIKTYHYQKSLQIFLKLKIF